MPDDRYRLGLLLLVFGGFVWTNTTDLLAGLGILVLLVGFVLGASWALEPAE
ncbi:hypothetical protein [Haloarchaeobius sp. DYHT-AS-18]|uniref:hypothetical protein n=1 Tax=Haloarchaeobius sp. DYHT-AS-18 TaxID=3446117 RepID=UPI003EB8B8BB